MLFDCLNVRASGLCGHWGCGLWWSEGNVNMFKIVGVGVGDVLLVLMYAVAVVCMMYVVAVSRPAADLQLLSCR